MFRWLTNRRVWFFLLVTAGLVAVAMWPETVPVDVAAVTRGPLVVTIDEEGETRVRDRFVVSSPVTGRVQRIELEVGDTVTAGQIVARVRPEAAPLLDARTRAEVQAAVEAATATAGRARAEEQRAKNALAHAEREQQRAVELAHSGLATRQEVEARAAEARASTDAAQAATYAAQAAASETRRAEARLAPSTGASGGQPVSVRAPVAGVVLKRLRESESLVPAGEPLVEIGDPTKLEIVSDLLSTDAVRVAPGARVLVDQWGGDRVLEAKVRRIEPSGFTKVSALGVEEQRVNVVCDVLDATTAWAALGDAYRVEVRIVQWEATRVLRVPTSALFREGADWAVYTVIGGRARRAVLQLGHRTGQDAEVLGGITEGAVVVLYPGDTVMENARVQPRAEP
jgi:HlyD family secretion protein